MEGSERGGGWRDRRGEGDINACSRAARVGDVATLAISVGLEDRYMYMCVHEGMSVQYCMYAPGLLLCQ